MFLAGCTSPSSNDSNDSEIEKPTLILNSEWSSSPETSFLGEEIEFTVLVNANFEDSWIGFPEITDPNGGVVEDYSWSRYLDSGKLTFSPNIIGDYSISIRR